MGEVSSSLLQPDLYQRLVSMLFWLSEAAEEEHPYKKVGACVWPCGSGEVMLLSLVIRLLLWGDVASAAAAAADPAADLDCCE